MAAIGFIGLGTMGCPIAGHLLDANHSVSLFNRSDSAYTAFSEKEAAFCNSPKDVAADSQIIFLCLPSHKEVTQSIYGEHGLQESKLNGKVILDLSTIDLCESKRFASHLKSEGACYLDCPISGGPKGAENATLSIMVGGDSAVYNEVRELLEILGTPIYCGDNGAGLAAKIANNLIVATTTVAISEAMCLAAKLGLAPDILFNILKNSTANSTILNAKVPMFLSGDYTPAFRLALMNKDLGIIRAAAHDAQVPLLLGGIVEQLYTASLDHADEDSAAVSLLYQKLYGTSLNL
jgi:3-hydroxyisobutyrate dehydrogenase-like beta-hydroxyacid dehydrogenase